MMKKITRCLLMGLAMASFTGCGLFGDSEESLTNQSFCNERSEAECAKLATQCPLNAVALGQCQKVRTQECVKVVQATGRSLKQKNAEACIAETERVFGANMLAPAWTA